MISSCDSLSLPLLVSFPFLSFPFLSFLSSPFPFLSLTRFLIPLFTEAALAAPAYAYKGFAGFLFLLFQNSLFLFLFNIFVSFSEILTSFSRTLAQQVDYYTNDPSAGFSFCCFFIFFFSFQFSSSLLF